MSADHVDVLIVGAGLSGIGAACHLQTNCPRKTYAILEARDAIGGTWDLFRYPGVRSDSDMFTLGYSFRPWADGKAIADGPAILEYVRETAREYGVEPHIRFNHRVVRAEWSSEDSRWTVEAQRTDSGETVRLTANFVFLCSGYYRYDEPFTPVFPGTDRFTGRIVHPQFWTDDIDYEGKRVVVVGSGATAVTLVPAMAEKAAHVTMLQRSPSYIVSLPGRDRIADFLYRHLPARLAYPLLRWKNVMIQTGFFRFCRRAPKLARRIIRKGVETRLPAGYDVDTHFEPSYEPWDQRLCLVPDDDLFKSISAGRASMVTDAIDSFTENGIRLGSGDELEADLVVTATGLNMLVLGGLQLTVDGREIHLPDTIAYKGLMLSGVPNMAFAVGYTNASWTLKCDLTCEYVCRILNHMDEHGYREVVPRLPDSPIPTQPLIDLKSGYVLRSVDRFPKQGLEPPWRLYQNYLRDIILLRRGEIEDGVLAFSSGAPAPAPAERVAA